METRPESPWPRWLDGAALFLGAFGALLRFWVSGPTAEPGFNLFIHLLFWLALGLWFASRALSGGFTYRLTGVEIPLAAFLILSFVSTLHADYKLASLDLAGAYLSFAVLFVLVSHALGWSGILSLLVPTLAALAAYGILQKLFLIPYVAGLPEAVSRAAQSEDFAQRIARREVWATLVYPNSFAGFLVLLLPAALGLAIDRRGKAAAVFGGAFALGLLALAFTGSLGGGVALAAALGAFGTLVLTRRRGRAAAVGAGMGAAAVGVALLLFSPLLGWLAARNHSMHVRQVYWQAAGRLVAEAPVLGAGLDNFQEHYFALKSDVQQETRKAHNDYLQIAAELGIPGLLVFLALLGLVLRRALARELPPIPAETPPPSWILPSAAALSLLAAWGLKRVFSDWAPLLVLAALWAVWVTTYLFIRRPASETGFTRLGVASGLAGLAVHMLVDFDFYDPAVAMALFLFFALVLVRGLEIRVPPAGALAAAGVVLVFALPLLLLAAPRVMEADGNAAQARAALGRYRARLGGGALDTGALTRALQASEAAQALNPLDPEGYELYAEAQFEFWRLLAPRASGPGFRELEEKETVVLQAIDNALAVRPRSSPAHAAKARYHRAFHQFYQARPNLPGAAGRAEGHLRMALESQRQTLRHYPTQAHVQYHLARLLDRAQRPDEAAPHYREALRLSDRATREPENLARLQLKPVQRARALRRSDRPLEAHDVLVAYLRNELRGAAPDELRRRLADPRERKDFLDLAFADEVDDEMRPVIDEALDAILSELK